MTAKKYWCLCVLSAGKTKWRTKWRISCVVGVTHSIKLNATCNNLRIIVFFYVDTYKLLCFLRLQGRNKSLNETWMNNGFSSHFQNWKAQLESSMPSFESVTNWSLHHHQCCCVLQAFQKANANACISPSSHSFLDITVSHLITDRWTFRTTQYRETSQMENSCAATVQGATHDDIHVRPTPAVIQCQ
jgi:hypothetical protein